MAGGSLHIALASLITEGIQMASASLTAKQTPAVRTGEDGHLLENFSATRGFPITSTAPVTALDLPAEDKDSDLGLDLVEDALEVTTIAGWSPSLTLQVLDVRELAPKEESMIYKQRAQIFRWRDSEWKERGTGDVMLLRNKETGLSRFLMWQEKTYKTVANFNIGQASSSCRLQVHSDDPRTWEWTCNDHSDGSPTNEKFALHFKTEGLAKEFQNAFDAAQTCPDQSATSLKAFGDIDDSDDSNNANRKTTCTRMQPKLVDRGVTDVARENAATPHMDRDRATSGMSDGSRACVSADETLQYEFASLKL